MVWVLSTGLLSFSSNVYIDSTCCYVTGGLKLLNLHDTGSSLYFIGVVCFTVIPDCLVSGGVFPPAPPKYPDSS